LPLGLPSSELQPVSSVTPSLTGAPSSPRTTSVSIKYLKSVSSPPPSPHRVTTSPRTANPSIPPVTTTLSVATPVNAFGAYAAPRNNTEIPQAIAVFGQLQIESERKKALLALINAYKNQEVQSGCFGFNPARKALKQLLAKYPQYKHFLFITIIPLISKNIRRPRVVDRLINIINDAQLFFQDKTGLKNIRAVRLWDEGGDFPHLKNRIGIGHFVFDFNQGDLFDTLGIIINNQGVFEARYYERGYSLNVGGHNIALDSKGIITLI
jgi:hypothetical protein